jgi:glucose-6-phosphate dehydrogenase assembly protein OpcA
MQAGPIRPDKILKELDELWVNLGKEGSEDGSGGVLRACAMTLIVCADDGEDDLGRTLGMLMRDHPSRLIVLRLLEGDHISLSANVLAQCWMPFGKRQQICCEQIEMRVTRQGLSDAAPVVRSITAADLPVVIWCRSRTLLNTSEFEPVLRFANKLIVDSAGLADLGAQIRLIRSVRGHDTRAADLAWTRLTPWREAVASIFDSPENLARLDRVRRVVIDYRGALRPMASCYFPAWLAHSLRRPLEAVCQRTGDAPCPRMSRVSLQGDGLDLSISAAHGNAIAIRSGTRDSHTVFPAPGEYELMREELMVPGEDPVFESVLNLAPEFA